MLKCFTVLSPTPSASQERVFLGLWAPSGSRRVTREKTSFAAGHSDPVGTSLQLTDCDRMTFKSSVAEWWRKTWPSGCSVAVAAAASHCIMEVCFAPKRKDTGRCPGRCVLITTSSHSATVVCTRSWVKTKLFKGAVLTRGPQNAGIILVMQSLLRRKYGSCCLIFNIRVWPQHARNVGQCCPVETSLTILFIIFRN